MSRPIRQLEECSSERCWSMNDRLCCMVCDVVVVAEAAVAGQAGGHALVAAVHGHQVDVDVDEQVRLGRPPVDLDVLALVGLARGGPGRRGPRRRAGAAGRAGRRRRRPGRRGRGAARPRSCAGAGPGRTISTTSSTPASAARSSTASMTRWRLSGRCIGGSGRRDVVEGDGQPHARRGAASGSGGLSPSGLSRAWRMAVVGIVEGVRSARAA